MKQAKTNAMRILEREGIAYRALEYETKDGALDGVSVAHKTGQDPQDVYKTLVTRGSDGGVYVFCIPVAEELQLKKAAKAAGVKSVEMLPVAQITPVTGYIKGGCSPVGMKKHYPTFVHESAAQREQVVVSGGRIGLQVALAPRALLAAAGAVYADLC